MTHTLKYFGGLLAVILKILTSGVNDGVRLDLPELAVEDPEGGVDLLVHWNAWVRIGISQPGVGPGKGVCSRGVANGVVFSEIRCGSSV